MNSSEMREEPEALVGSNKKAVITAIGTGLLFWTSLFGLLFFCLRS